ncbi:MAG: hypothetical protein IJ467_05490, partial [Bacteroidaceae bacterium]|nr:hypothetical protein [Bacteroidaceae bacterium]
SSAILNPLSFNVPMMSGVSSGSLVYGIVVINKKVPPWYAGLREAWRILVLQRYNKYLNLQVFIGEKIISIRLHLKCRCLRQFFFASLNNSCNAYCQPSGASQMLVLTTFALQTQKDGSYPILTIPAN